MSLNYCGDSKERNVTKLLGLVCKDVRLSLPLHRLKSQEPKHKGLEWLLPTRQGRNGRTLCHLVRLLGHCTLETIFRNTLRRPHAFSNECTVQATQNGLSICVASVRPLSARPCIWLYALIYGRISRGCTRPVQPFILPQGKDAQSGSTTTAGCLPDL